MIDGFRTRLLRFGGGRFACFSFLFPESDASVHRHLTNHHHHRAVFFSETFIIWLFALNNWKHEVGAKAATRGCIYTINDWQNLSSWISCLEVSLKHEYEYTNSKIVVFIGFSNVHLSLAIVSVGTFLGLPPLSLNVCKVMQCKKLLN